MLCISYFNGGFVIGLNAAYPSISMLGVERSIREGVKEKAKEAEDVATACVPRARFTDDYKVRMDVADRMGHIWACAEYSLNKWGGHILKYTLKDEYRNPLRATQRIQEIFPAVEWLPTEMYYKQVYTWLGVSIAINEDQETITCEIPDREALLANWEVFRREHPEFPPFDTAASSGIASDEGYIWAHITHGGLYSSKGQTFHDWGLHIYPVIKEIVSNPSGYLAKKKEMQKDLLSYYAKIWRASNQMPHEHPNRQYLRIFVTALAIRAEMFTNFPTWGYLKKPLPVMFGYLLENDSRWVTYMKQRFPEAKVREVQEKMDEIWQSIEAFSAQDAIRSSKRQKSSLS